MEARIARLESEVSSLRTHADISDAVTVRLERRINQLERGLEALREARFNTWILVGHFAILAVLVGALAHGFGWI